MPLYDSDYEEKRKLKIGEVYQCDVKKPRNYEFLKKFFALIRLGAENTPLNMPQEPYRAYVTMKAGYAEVFDTPGGKMALPKSISFAKMDDNEFAGLYQDVIQVIITDIGADQQMIEENLINYM